VSQFNRVKNLKVANEIWKKLMKIHEGTSSAKEAKLYVLKEKFSEFVMKKKESVAQMDLRAKELSSMAELIAPQPEWPSSKTCPHR